jgi:predicted homoserine dehydrogenase-like protein
MIYEQLFARVTDPAVVRAGFVGSGVFSTPMITQAQIVPRLDVPIIADVDVEAGRSAFLKAGLSADDILVCDSTPSALQAMERGKSVVVQDADLLMDLPLHVIVTATRVPEAAVRYATRAIQHGKHVVMVDKEAESVVGPILKYEADRQGVVFTTDFGDQPGILMGLVSWARALGFEVLCAGNIRSYRYDPQTGVLRKRFDRAVTVPEADRWAFERIPTGETARYVAVRQRAAEPFSTDEECGDPICHMVLAANGTGILPDTPVGHRPALWWEDFPEVLCPQDEGGILRKRGVMDEPYLLRTPGDPSPGGSVFVVVACDDEVSRRKMAAGLFSNRQETAMLIYRAYQLGSSEANLSILCAGLLGVGATAEIYPHVDMVARAARDMRAGEVVGSSPGTLGWDHSVRAAMVPAFPLAAGNPVPFFLLSGNRLVVDVPADTVFTLGMIQEPENSALWALRRKQDAVFMRS